MEGVSEGRREGKKKSLQQSPSTDRVRSCCLILCLSARFEVDEDEAAAVANSNTNNKFRNRLAKSSGYSCLLLRTHTDLMRASFQCPEGSLGTDWWSLVG